MGEMNELTINISTDYSKYIGPGKKSVAEFSGEELHKFWCSEERYKERQGIGEIIDAYKNKQSGWPDQLDEKQVQCSLKETRDVFFYYLFYALLNRYKKLKNQGC